MPFYLCRMLYETVAALLWNSKVVRALKREHSWWLVDRQCPVLTDFDWHSACGLQPLLLARAVLDKAICVGNHTIHGHWKKEVSVMLLSKEWLVLLGLLAMFLCKGNMQRNSGHKVFGSSLRARRVGNLKTWVICCKQKLKVEMQFAESVHTTIVMYAPLNPGLLPIAHYDFGSTTMHCYGVRHALMILVWPR